MASSQAPYTSEELLAQANWLGNLARALVRDSADAGDLAQDTMEVALVKPPKSDGPIRPWLAGVARNLVRMNYRSDKRRRAREDLAPMASETVPVDDAIDQLTLQGHVAEKVRGLPEPYQETVLLRYYEGLTAAEIGTRIGCPAGTVRWRLKKGMDQLRKALDRQYDGKRGAWVLALAPMAKAASATNAPAMTGKGLVFMSMIWKGIVALGIVLCFVFGGRYFNLWGEPDAKSPVNDTLVQEKTKDTRPESPKAQRGQKLSFLVQRDPVGEMRLEGQVIDEQDRGVSGATVVLNTTPRRSVVSDTYGNFLFEHLPERTLRIEAGADTMFAGPLEFEMRPETEPVTLVMRPAGRVSVTVIGAKGEVLKGAGVSLFSSSEFEWAGTSNAKGESLLSGVGAGSHVLKVSMAGYAPTLQSVRATGKVDVVQQVRVQLKYGAPVSGQVVDEKGEGISGALVWAESSSEPFPIYSPSRDAVVTDDRGNWTIAAVSTGNYRILANHESFAPTSTSPMLIDGATGRERILLTMKIGATVVGKVVDSQREAVEGAQVRLITRGNTIWRSGHSVISDEKGEYRVSGLRPGIVDVVASHRSGSSEVLPLTLYSDKVMTLELSLSNVRRLAGTVVDPQGEGVSEAQVALEPVWTRQALQRRNWAVRGSSVVIADGGGSFEFHGLPEGKYKIRALRPGQPAASLWIDNGQEVNTGEDKVQIVLPEPGRILGKVQLEDGSSLESFFVQVGGGTKTPFASKDGLFSMEAPEGAHQLRVSGAGIVPKFVDVEIVGETNVETIVVRSGRSVSGRVVDGNGLGVAGAQVVAGKLLSGDGKNLYIPSESINAQSVETDEEGRFIITGFDQQILTIVAGLGDSRSPSLKLPGGNESLEVDLVIAAQGALSGTVVKDGTPVAQTIIIAKPVGATSSNFFVASGPEGHYSFDLLSPGEYIIFPMLGGGGGKTKDMYMKRVDVRMGEQQVQDINITTGQASFEISVENKMGDSVPSAVMVMQGDIPEGMSMEELREASWLPMDKGPVGIFLRAALSDSAEVLGIVAGKYTLCAQVFGFDPNDPIAMMMMRSVPNTRPPHCISTSINEGTRKKVTVKVPTLEKK